MKHFEEIYELQRDLNILVGRDTVDDKDKIRWGFDYFVALMGEAYELLDCTNWKWWTKEGKINQYQEVVDLKNAKIEAIDCLHFLMSLIQVFDVSKDFLINQAFYNFNKNKFVSEYCLDIISYCILSMKVINSNDTYIIPNTLTNEFIINTNIKEINFESRLDIKKNILKCFKYLMIIFEKLGMTDEDILKIYEMKHEKNVLRQKNNYSVLTKTEDDNNEIKKQI